MNKIKGQKSSAGSRALRNAVRSLRRPLRWFALANAFLLAMILAVSASGPNFNDTDNKPVSSASPSFSGTITLPGGAWSTNGNVGIGSASPQAKLDVEGAVYFGTGNVGINSATPAARLDVNGTIYGHSNVGIGTASPAAGLQVGTGSSSLSATLGSTAALIKGNLEVDGKIYGDGSSLTNLSSSSQWSGTAGSAIYYNSANVGIGSAVPQQKLDVEGTVYFGSGNVGIGTSAPGYLLEAKSPSSGMVARFGGPNTSNIVLYQDSTSSYIGGYYGGTAVRFSIMGGPYLGSAVSILADGSINLSGSNVGIGSSAPQQKLDVEGGVYVGSGGNIGIGTSLPVAGLQVGTGSSSLSATLGSTAALIKGNLEVDGKIYGDGSGLTNLSSSSQWSGTAGSAIYYNSANVGIGSASPQAKLDVEGTVYFGAGNVGIGSVTPAASLDVNGTIYGHNNLGIGISSARALLDVEGAVYLRGNVGIGSTSPQMLLEVKNGSFLGTEYPVTTAASMTINWANGNQQYVSLNQAGHTINFSNYKAGQILRLIVCQNGASRTVTTWDSSIVWASGSAPTLTATSGQCDIISFICTNAKGAVKNFGAITSNF